MRFLRYLLIALSTSCLGLAHPASADDHQYVTRFEDRDHVTYTPQVKLVEKTYTRRSWNPFRATTTTIERKLVPVVSWKPSRRKETVPVTERVAIKNPRRIAQKEEWQLGGVKPTDRAPTHSKARSIVEWKPYRTAPNGEYGGVQRLDQDMPRYGMKLRELR